MVLDMKSRLSAALNLSRKTIGLTAIILGLTLLSDQAKSYALRGTDTCDPGQKWDMSRPVQVKLLEESYLDFLARWKRQASAAERARIDADIKAMIDLYNAVPGSGLTFEWGGDIKGDQSLDRPGQDDFGDQTIVIGFTDRTARPASEASGEALVNVFPGKGCTIQRAHARFRKDVDWVFGPPDGMDVRDDRRFYNQAYPPIPGVEGPPLTFLGILTHEIGHAVGLRHPRDDYAIMAQGFSTWFRAPDDRVRTQLLPDDMAGILELYGTSEARDHLDISVSSSWYLSGAERIGKCLSSLAKSKGSGAKKVAERCEKAKRAGTAMQRGACRPSSRGDRWADHADGKVLCGVNDPSHSAFPPVDDIICPGDHVQVRYALNNHSMFREALVKSEAWFSTDKILNARQGDDHLSTDIHEVTIEPGNSHRIDHMFRLPATVPEGQPLWMFVRAVPHDTQADRSLWAHDADSWNNAIMLKTPITALANACG